MVLNRAVNVTGVPFNASSAAAAGGDLVNPMINWGGHQQLLLVYAGQSRLWFANVDHMNTPPLRGVYHPFSGMISGFQLDFWVCWADPLM